jgi:hypothetical protein
LKNNISMINNSLQDENFPEAESLIANALKTSSSDEALHI